MYQIDRNLGVSSMYKTDKTTYVVRSIPVKLWKQVKSKFLMTEHQHKSIGSIIINLLDKWVKEDKDDWKQT